MRPLIGYATAAVLGLAALAAVGAAGALEAEGRAQVAACEAQGSRVCGLASLDEDLGAAQAHAAAQVAAAAGVLVLAGTAAWSRTAPADAPP